MFKVLSLLSILALALPACNNNEEIGNSKDVNPETIYFDYRVWGDEETGMMTVKLQYRYAGPNGTPLALEPPSMAMLDGSLVDADSSLMSGVYYEVSRPVEEFSGEHTIEFTDDNGKKYLESFSFTPISIKNELPALVSRGDLVIELEGLKSRDFVRVMLTDTAFFSEGITRTDTVDNGRIIISKEDLQTLSNGPINMELAKEVDRRIKNGTPEGGKLSISYGIKREFELKDP